MLIQIKRILLAKFCWERKTSHSQKWVILHLILKQFFQIFLFWTLHVHNGWLKHGSNNFALFFFFTILLTFYYEHTVRIYQFYSDYHNCHEYKTIKIKTSPLPSRKIRLDDWLRKSSKNSLPITCCWLGV